MSGTVIDIRNDRLTYSMCEDCDICRRSDVPVVVARRPAVLYGETEKQLFICEACADHMSAVFET